MYNLENEQQRFLSACENSKAYPSLDGSLYVKMYILEQTSPSIFTSFIFLFKALEMKIHAVEFANSVDPGSWWATSSGSILFAF